MSITTKTGDDGTTGLMYGRRVSKTHARVEACGAVDELNAALGLARSVTRRRSLKKELLTVQQELVAVMGELATARRDRPRYRRDGYGQVTHVMIEHLEAGIALREAQTKGRCGWAIPGATETSAALDMARAICRRAERRVCRLKEKGALPNAAILVYLNRLGDWLWLAARLEEGGNRRKS